jgi:hypothetical protein
MARELFTGLNQCGESEAKIWKHLVFLIYNFSSEIPNSYLFC